MNDDSLNRLEDLRDEIASRAEAICGQGVATSFTPLGKQGWAIRLAFAFAVNKNDVSRLLSMGSDLNVPLEIRDKNGTVEFLAG